MKSKLNLAAELLCIVSCNERSLGITNTKWTFLYPQIIANVGFLRK